METTVPCLVFNVLGCSVSRKEGINPCFHL